MTRLGRHFPAKNRSPAKMVENRRSVLAVLLLSPYVCFRFIWPAGPAAAGVALPSILRIDRRPADRATASN